jgi:two-component system, NarL family, sensor kinase
MASEPSASAPSTSASQHPGSSRRRTPRRRELIAFLTIALLAMLAVAAGIILIGGKIARDTALHDAEDSATRLATFVFEPLLSDDGEAGQREALDRVVDARMTDGALILVIVWSPEGEVVYSSDPALEGRRTAPRAELTRAVNGEVVSEIEEQPELGPVGDGGPLLEVYAPLTVDGRPLAFEAYFSTDMIERDIAVLTGEIVPLAVGALAVLQLVQIPIVVSLGRRLSRHEAERAELVVRHLADSDRERRMIAADVHDGPVQDLAGVSYGLGALRPGLTEAQRASVDRMIGALRGSVASLRRLMIEIYPPDLSGPGLPTAIDDLAASLRERGVTVHVTGDDLPEMSPSSVAVLYRTAKEALANVARHAGAENVWICLERDLVGEDPAVRLTVEDDGVGLPAALDGTTPGDVVRSNGHLGLRLVRDRIADQGGTVRISTRSSGGTVLDAVVPVAR